MQNAYLGFILYIHVFFIPEKYVFWVCFESPFKRMISSLKCKCPPSTQYNYTANDTSTDRRLQNYSHELLFVLISTLVFTYKYSAKPHRPCVNRSTRPLLHFFSLKNTFKNYFINYHNIIHLSLVRRTRQTLKTKPLIMLSID